MGWQAAARKKTKVAFPLIAFGNPLLGHQNRLSKAILRRTQFNQARPRCSSRPGLRSGNIKSQQQLSVIVQDWHAANINGKYAVLVCKTVFDPEFPMDILFPAQERPSVTPQDPVIKRPQQGINQDFAGSGHEFFLTANAIPLASTN